MEDSDALVVGGGPAGLSAALYLARYNRTVTVLDSWEGRSTHHQVNHNYLGFVDGIAAVDLRKAGREQLALYDQVQVIDHAVAALTQQDDRFVADATWRARTVVLATGVLDHYPYFLGWEDYVGTSVFWCITCDGWENRGRDVVVVGHTDVAACEALQLHSLTDRVRLLTNSPTDEISPVERRRLEAAGIPVIHDRLVAATGEGGRLRTIETERGTTLELEALFSLQGATPQTGLAQQLGVALDDAGYVVIDTEQKTSVPGVLAAGDVTSLHSHQVTTAVHEGAQAASAANYFLYPPELRVP